MSKKITKYFECIDVNPERRLYGYIQDLQNSGYYNITYKKISGWFDMVDKYELTCEIDEDGN